LYNTASYLIYTVSRYQPHRIYTSQLNSNIILYIRPIDTQRKSKFRAATGGGGGGGAQGPLIESEGEGVFLIRNGLTINIIFPGPPKENW
jgi:hypothetical protein